MAKYGIASWVGLGVILVAGLGVAVSGVNQPKVKQTEKPEPVILPDKPAVDFTAAEFDEFKGAISTLDPDERVFLAMSLDEELQYMTVIVTDAFANYSKVNKIDVMKSTRALAQKTCDCRPTLAFYTQGEAKVGQITVGEPSIENL